MYYIFYGIIYAFSLLPLRILYVFSDFICFFLYYVMRYRREVVMDNLTHAFPEKSEEEKTRIAKKFYRNFTDNFIEIVKMVSASDNYIKKHLIADCSILETLYESGKSCNLVLGHNFNWEWANYSIGLQIKYQLLVVYMPINSGVVDRLFRTIRQKGNAKLLSAHNMLRDFMPYRKSQYTLVLAADQNPGDPTSAYWLNFFGRPAPFVTGPEKGVRPQNLPVVFAVFKKIKRGYYTVNLELMEDNPKALPEGELTRRFVRYLEQVISQDPDLWLWSHKRWKHTWQDSYMKLWVDTDPPALASNSATEKAAPL
ncbi:MAG: lysophospholipid acyltransferase family protein [Chitinophagaceae bacterium]